MAKPPTTQVGDLVGGKYRVERVLGEGGIGVVVLARHIELGQPVALKVLRIDDDEAILRRFMREARAVVRLRGEHVVRVIDVLRLKTGAPVMVMEYLEGFDLANVVGRGTLGIPEAVDFLLQACEGVAEAHSLGIVHRDLKPENLFLARQPHGQPVVKVLDFGIAKAFTGIGEDVALTSTKAIMGSPAYMSPEQMRATRDVDARTDVWSLGVVLYELLAGTAPFDGVSVADLCASVLTKEPVPIRERRADVPADLANVIAGCLTKDASQRIRSVGDLAMALEPFAPVSSHGAAARIRAVLDAPIDAIADLAPSEPQLAAADALGAAMASRDPGSNEVARRDHVQTSATFESLLDRARPRPWRTAVAIGAALGALAAGIFLGVRPSPSHPASEGQADPHATEGVVQPALAAPSLPDSAAADSATSSAAPRPPSSASPMPTALGSASVTKPDAGAQSTPRRERSTGPSRAPTPRMTGYNPANQF